MRPRRSSRGCSGIMTPGVMYPEKAGQGRGSRKPERSSEVIGMRRNLWKRHCRSALRTCDWKGTAQVRKDRGRRDRDHLEASRRKGLPQVRLWAPIGSKGGRGARKGSLASGTCVSPPWCQGGRRPRGGPAPGGCIPVPRSPRMMSTTAVREEVEGGEWKEDPVPLGQGSWTRDIIEKSGTGAGRRARGIENILASTGQFSRGQAGRGHHQERRLTRTRKGT